MRIESNALQFAPAAATSVAAESPYSPVDGDSAGGDRVQLSSLAQFSMGESPKVPRLAAEFAAGRYSIAPRHIATGIITEHLALQ